LRDFDDVVMSLTAVDDFDPADLPRQRPRPAKRRVSAKKKRKTKSTSRSGSKEEPTEAK
jgi:hypothetical protein